MVNICDLNAENARCMQVYLTCLYLVLMPACEGHTLYWYSMIKHALAWQDYLTHSSNKHAEF